MTVEASRPAARWNAPVVAEVSIALSKPPSGPAQDGLAVARSPKQRAIVADRPRVGAGDAASLGTEDVAVPSGSIEVPGIHQKGQAAAALLLGCRRH